MGALSELGSARESAYPGDQLRSWGVEMVSNHGADCERKLSEAPHPVQSRRPHQELLDRVVSKFTTLSRIRFTSGVQPPSGGAKIRPCVILFGLAIILERRK